LQKQHVQEAAKTPSAFAKANGGHPPIAATPKPAAFHAAGVVGAHGAPAEPSHPVSAEQTRATHPPASAPKAPPSTAKPNAPKPNVNAPKATQNAQKTNPNAPKPPAAKPPAPPKPAAKAPPPKPKHEPEGENK
jgi:hypothetical protein